MPEKMLFIVDRAMKSVEAIILQMKGHIQCELYYNKGKENPETGRQPGGAFLPSKTSVLSVIIVLLFSASADGGRAGRDSFFLVRDKRPAATVVYEPANPLARRAAEDLAFYVEKMSGVRLKVRESREDAPGPTLHIGRTCRFDGLSKAIERVRIDGFAMARTGEDLIVAGAIPQGTANGVTTILQDHFGVRWYHPGPLWEVVPVKSSLAISFSPTGPGNACVENPDFIERSLWGGVPDRDFGRRARLTMKGVKLPYTGTGHHLNRVVNPGKHGSHPEYFAFWDGRHHIAPDVHPCFTHPDMPGIFLDYMAKGNGSLGVNDNLSACRCGRCLKVDGKSPPYQGMVNVSESYFQLIARVAKEAARTRPDLRLGVFAYQLTNRPPKTVDHIGANVDVILCQDTSQYFDAGYANADRAMSAEWVKKCGHVRFYDYMGINYWTPRYFPRMLAGQLRHLARSGVAGYGTHASSMMDSAMPMYYVLYRLLWDADLDSTRLIARMLHDLYGPAAETMARFYDLWEMGWMRQKTGKWFFGMDDFRGEMSLYSWEDFERGRRLLDQAASEAMDKKGRLRIAYLRDRYAFTHESARAFERSMAAIRWKPTADHADAIRLSNRAADAWWDWVRRFEKTLKLDGTPLSGWINKTCRVRAWSLKQQMRDAVLAPLVRWACFNEGRLPPSVLREKERILAGVGMLNMSTIERGLTQRVEAVSYPVRVDGLLVADVPRVRKAPLIDGGESPWQRAGPLNKAPWHFLDFTVPKKIGKYEDPVARHHYIMDRPPARDDLSVTSHAAWDASFLYLRIRVRDERHVQGQAPPAMWKEDSIRVALNPDRSNFLYDCHSWTYIWGGYRGCELDVGVALKAGDTHIHLKAVPKRFAGSVKPETMIRTVARRHNGETVYDIAVDWRLLPDFKPRRERSIGIWLAAHDMDKGERMSAEYGGPVNRVGRPSGFSAIRLVD